MKAIVLARESDKKQDSNEAQLLRISEYIKHKNLEVWQTYELKESSTQGDRKKFQAIIKQIEEAKETIALVVDTVDRLQRSFKESVQLDELRKAGKIEIHFYRENLVIHKDSNSADILRWDMAVMFAKSYVLQLSDNVKRKQAQMLANGIYPSQPPYGYKRVPIEGVKDKTEIVVDDYTSKFVAKVYELYATKAYSMDSLLKKIKKDYSLEWNKSHLENVLKNKFYIGIMKWNEKEYPHKYPHLLGEDLFYTVQDIKAGFNKKKHKYEGKKPFMYRGMLRCAHCGLAITVEEQKGTPYYHCTQSKGKHGAKWLREDAITEQIGEVFKKVQVPEHVVNEILGSLKNIHEGKMAFRKQQYEDLTKEHEKYTNRLEKLYIDRLDGRITDTKYDEFYQSFREKVNEIDGRISALQDAEDNYYITSKYLLELANRAYDLFLSSKVEERRQLINLVLSNLRIEEDKVCYDAVKPFDVILNFADCPSWLPRVDSNHQPAG